MSCRRGGRRWGGARLAVLLAVLLALLGAAGAATAGDHALGRAQGSARGRAHAGIAPGDRVGMPRGNPAGWREVFADDFTGDALDPARWLSYDGEPGGDPAGWFDPSHVTVSRGMLTISAYRDPRRDDLWTTGGVSSSPGLTQTYGRYLVRFRMSAGVGVSYALVLWPADNVAPPEIDFSEDNGSEADGDVVTLHYDAGDRMSIRDLHVNLTHWQTLGVQWLPGRLDFTLNGRRWAEIVNPAVPAVPMVLDMQTQTWPCAPGFERCPGSFTPPRMRFQVDWVVAYARARRDA